MTNKVGLLVFPPPPLCQNALFNISYIGIYRRNSEKKVVSKQLTFFYPNTLHIAYIYHRIIIYIEILSVFF